MNLSRILAAILCGCSILLSGCGSGNGFEGRDDSSSSEPASNEPPYYGKPTDIDNADAVTVTVPAIFRYRGLSFSPGVSTNGLTNVVNEGMAIAFAEFHIYDASGTRIQQGETTTDGTAEFKIPKTEGTYTIKVFSRAQNSFLKVSILKDIYGNTPHFASLDFTITASDITAGTKDLTSTPVIAQADENLYPGLEGGAFNIMYNILLANEYIRRNISKNIMVSGVPSADPDKWWVADKVTVYWKAGFNPYSYFGSNSPLSFYSPGDRKLFILGGVSGDVKSSDTDHFDDSVILHEYGHFLEDVYGNSASPGGSHNGNFVIDARLAWSEGWANYLQAAVLTGADAASLGIDESRVPDEVRYHYYVDTYGYKGNAKSGVSISFNLWENGATASMDNTGGSDLEGTGTFREVSVSRTLYKTTRKNDAVYSGANTGAGVAFADIWKTFSGEDTSGHRKNSNPLATSLVNLTKYPIPNVGLFNYLLSQNINANSKWDTILTEEKQSKTTKDYAYNLTATGGSCPTTFTVGTKELSLGGLARSNQQVNNDFYLFYYDGSGGTLAMTYTSTLLNLDLILYKKDYIYFEDAHWYAGYSSPYIVRQSRSASSTTESISLSGLAAGYYVINVKINAYNKENYQMSSSATYSLTRNGVALCGSER
ncbi:hypothetical protein EZJ49_04815 [Bdellovibrio bacteriovorus]|uniref:hypothetical protein n=1 Tax=Bdellovibrio bacteriovorus TaxID=959 RepID=UPI0021D3D7AD|nr:hypothetical protein [Bdellovibrio bacteriovorus]UXR65571.1 hypothetical protein EZJ49_04815 [Bdellovibrio bacteriovorus]